MRNARLMIALTLLVPGLALASADREEEAVAPEEPPPLPGQGELMGASYEVSAHVFGRGRIIEARIEEHWHRGEAVAAIRTARGWSNVDLGVGISEGTFYTVEEMRLEGDRLVVEINRYHDPCGCDDGPVWSDTYRSVCRVTQSGRVRCSAPRLIDSYDTAP